jgi:hypothetical protein
MKEVVQRTLCNSRVRDIVTLTTTGEERSTSRIVYIPVNCVGFLTTGGETLITSTLATQSGLMYFSSVKTILPSGVI